MDLKKSTFVFASVLCLTAASNAFAAAKLRLETTALGPIPVAQNQNGPALRVNASNAGDAALNLSASSSASWLSATPQASQSCGTLGNCIPIAINLNTASLAKGSYTATITISDPAAIDAPQNISVTVLVGGGVPDSLTFFVPANGGAVSQSFTAARTIATNISQPSSASLSIAAPSGGSLATNISYTVTALANAGAAPGNYTGSITTAGSTIASENKTIPVSVNVSSGPIASPSALAPFRIALGSAKQTQNVSVANQGSGTLTVSTVTANSTGGAWLTATNTNGVIAVTADPSGLTPGDYTGSVTIASNAANASVTVPVQLSVLAAGPPVAYANSVVSNATFQPGGTLAQGDLPAVFGEQFTAGDAVAASSLPWPTSLGGTTVFVNDQPVPVYFVSTGQINFQIPFDAAPGDATLRVDRNGQRGNTVSLRIAKAAPRFLIAVNEQGAVVSSPFGGPVNPVKAGTVVVIYSLGFGQTNPPVVTAQAAPSNPLALVPGTNFVYFGTGGLFSNPVRTTPSYVGLTPGSSGLYQVNVQIPPDAPKGSAVPVFLQGDVVGSTNSLLFNIQ